MHTPIATETESFVAEGLRPRAAVDAMQSLTAVSRARGLDKLEPKLVELRAWLEGDLGDVESALADVGTARASLAERAGRHLLDQSGKRIRPICVALAARAGSGFNEAARLSAVAVELVHNATLLHDDVVDVGEMRRGAPTSRTIYGNAASIFAGDWLLVEALSRIQRAALPGAMEKAIDVILRMVVAETMQLERRGKVNSSVEDYFRIVEGKTAALFEWAMFAGARAGGLSADATVALEAFGKKVGVAFQLVDDVLDVAGEANATGKALLADLREGKMTYPLLLALERDAELAPLLEGYCEGEGALDGVAKSVMRAMAAANVVDDCHKLADRLVSEAIETLSALQDSPAKTALAQVAAAIPRRRR